MRKIFRNFKASLKALFATNKSKKILTSFLNRTKGEKILLVSHQLTTTGSPLMLFHLAKELKKQGFSPFVLSYTGGSLIHEFKKHEIDVTLGEVFQTNAEAFKNIAKHFDKIIVNTIVCYSAVEQYNEAMWWIHEGQNIETSFMKDFPAIEDTLRKAKNIFVVSEYAKEVVEKYNSNVKITRLGVEDHYKENKSKTENEKIKFALVGNICECKAQDVLIDAISQMDKKNLEKCEFHFFCAKKGHRYRNTVKKIKHLKNIFFDGLFTSQEAKWKIFADMDVFVIPSRDESCSLVALEACMLKKPIIISENVGAKYMIKENENGYIVKTEDGTALKNAIQNIVDNKENLQTMGEISRSLYEEKASFELFKSELEKLIEHYKSVENSQVLTKK